jgi:hypothetical protein
MSDMRKLVNCLPTGIPVNLRDPATGREVVRVLPGTLHHRKGPPSGWRTEYGVLLVSKDELSPHVRLLKGRGHLRIEEVADTASPTPAKAEPPSPPPPPPPKEEPKLKKSEAPSEEKPSSGGKKRKKEG